MSVMTEIDMGTGVLELDAQRTETFAERMVTLLNDAALALMISVGHRTRLFETLAGRGPGTMPEIAEAARLHERYVREWLAAMTVGGIVEYDAASRTYRLPPEHAAWLTPAAGADNLAVQAQYIAVLASVEDRIVECFREGGGVPYSAFHRFHEVMREDSGARMDQDLIERIIPLAPGIPSALERGIDVLEIGCGAGHALNLLAAAYPASRFVGYDFAPETIRMAREETDELGLDNVIFDVVDVARLDEPSRYDLVLAFDAVHDQVAPLEVLRGVRRVLRPGGTFLMQDVRGSSELEINRDHPLGALLYTTSCMHCMTVSLAGGGPGLGTMWGRETATELLERAGFVGIEIKSLENDPFNDTYVMRA
jgi:2-polyprenyl-3-methyl-5-hydroxy-6-metoxy-1,4-benzoquinol methylase